MTARDHYVANQAPDWRAVKPGHKAPAQRLPKAVRKALRDYRRKVISMADEAACSWGVLVLIGIASVVILLTSAWGLMP